MTKLLSTTIISIAIFITMPANAGSANCKSNDCKHIAEAVYHEARGEGKQGMIAVANVIMNRTKSMNISAASVVQQPKQFSYRGKRNLSFSDKKSYDLACSIANDAVNKRLKDNTNGATYFRSGGGSWGKSIKHTVTIGSHRFFKDIR